MKTIVVVLVVLITVAGVFTFINLKLAKNNITNEVTTQDMFWGKKYKKIAEYPTNDWFGAETGTKGEDYTLFRVNKGLTDAAGHPDYPIRVGVAIPTDSLQEENDTLNAVEDMLVERLETTELGVLAMVVSRLDGQQFKEFVFYTKENVDFKKLHEDIQSAFPKYEVQFYAENDPEWSLYKEYILTKLWYSGIFISPVIKSVLTCFTNRSRKNEP